MAGDSNMIISPRISDLLFTWSALNAICAGKDTRSENVCLALCDSSVPNNSEFLNGFAKRLGISDPLIIQSGNVRFSGCLGAQQKEGSAKCPGIGVVVESSGLMKEKIFAARVASRVEVVEECCDEMGVIRVGVVMIGVDNVLQTICLDDVECEVKFMKALVSN
jgi:hypothetical protein